MECPLPCAYENNLQCGSSALCCVEYNIYKNTVDDCLFCFVWSWTNSAFCYIDN